MSLGLFMLSTLAILFNSNYASNIVRRLSQGDDDWYCVGGQTENYCYNSANAVKGNYQKAGKDENGNDFWVMELDGADCGRCNPMSDKFYIRRDPRYTPSNSDFTDGRYEIAQGGVNNHGYLSHCEHTSTDPASCNNWIETNFGNKEGQWYDQSLSVVKGKCQIRTENYLTAIIQNDPSPVGLGKGCNGDFTKDTSRNDFYVRTERYEGSEYAWYFNYPSQKWKCTSGDYIRDARMTNKACRGGGYDEGSLQASLNFHN